METVTWRATGMALTLALRKSVLYHSNWDGVKHHLKKVEQMNISTLKNRSFFANSSSSHLYCTKLLVQNNCEEWDFFVFHRFAITTSVPWKNITESFVGLVWRCSKKDTRHPPKLVQNLHWNIGVLSHIKVDCWSDVVCDALLLLIRKAKYGKVWKNLLSQDEKFYQNNRGEKHFAETLDSLKQSKVVICLQTKINLKESSAQCLNAKGGFQSHSMFCCPPLALLIWAFLALDSLVVVTVMFFRTRASA